MELSAKTCGSCDFPVLDDLSKITSFCTNCSNIWMDSVVHNPLAGLIKLDLELVAHFDEIFDRCG